MSMIRAAKMIAPLVAGAIALTAVSWQEASAGVPYTNAPFYFHSAQSHGLVQHVWWRGGWGWWGPGVAAGVLAGAAVGAATAPYYYPPYYYYPPGYYYPPNPCRPGYHLGRDGRYCYVN
jgi:hypothetical protein